MNKIPKTIICKDVTGAEHIVPVENLSYRPSVYGILIEDNAILLSKQFGDGYDFPGGGLEMRETLEQGVRREVWEETGLDVSVGKTVWCQSSFFYFNFSEDKRATHSILMYFLVTKTGGKLTTEHFDEDEKQYAELAEWVPLDRISSLKFYNSADSPAVIKRARGMLACE